MKKLFFTTIFSLFATSMLLAETGEVQNPETAETGLTEKEKPLEEVQVIGVRKRLEQTGALADTILKTEVVGITKIDDKNAVNLSEAIDNSPGVRVSNDCSMCGFKRVMLNGLKGDQTVVLVDRLPTHTLISGFYAFDAIPTTGVESIEVARGAGASLIAPEAIGGTVNVVTLRPTGNNAKLDISTGQNGYQKVGVLGTGISDDGATELTLIGQYDVRDQFDGDNNAVSETPFMENNIYTVRLSHDLTNHDNLTFRFAKTTSEVFGGPILGNSFADGNASSIGAVISRYDGIGNETAATPAQDLFQGGDVNNRYIGKAWETAEWIKTEREEFSASWLHELNDVLNLTLSNSYANHIQDSFYEGFDYFADDEMLFLDARLNWIATDVHLITVGIDNREEEMRSDSFAGSSSSNYVSDSFDYSVLGFYIQDQWQSLENLEVALALRFDQIDADFIDPSKPGTEIEENIISPRVDMRYLHNDQWTSRLSSGRGYRAPLSFFETDHGLLDSGQGFLVDVDELERSVSVTYALSFEGEALTATLSLAHTEVENLAALDETDEGVPLLTQLDEKAGVSAYDLATSYAFSDHLEVSFIMESFSYDEAFRSSYTSAPIEERLTLSADYEISGWDIFSNLTWVGSRDLGDYGYTALNRVDTTGSVIESSTKTQSAPSYFTLDFKVSKVLSQNLNFYFGANNLLDYNQANDEDSPLMFDDEGGYDVAYIYAPLRGREGYVGIQYDF